MAKGMYREEQKQGIVGKDDDAGSNEGLPSGYMPSTVDFLHTLPGRGPGLPN